MSEKEIKLARPWTQKEMQKEAIESIRKRKKGRHKLTYDKETKTIVAVPNKDKLTEEGLERTLFKMKTDALEYWNSSEAKSQYGREKVTRETKKITQAYTQIKEIVREHFEVEKEWKKAPLRLIDAKRMIRSAVKENVELKQQKTVTRTEIENAVGDTSDEYLEGVIELFESKGFTVEMGK